MKAILIVIGLIILPACSPFKSKSEVVPELKELLTDLAFYKVHHVQTLHEGDLLEHSVWAHYAATRMIEEGHPLAAGYAWTQRDKELVGLACLLHDIGKAGRKELFDDPAYRYAYKVYRATGHDGPITKVTFGHDHEEHVGAGFKFIATACANFQPSAHYMMIDGSFYDFNKLFDALEINHNEQKQIAILVGMHYDFGKLMRQDLTVEDYLQRLRHYAQQVGYQKVDQRLLRMAILTQNADVVSLSYVPPCPTWIFKEPVDYPAPRSIIPAAYERFGYTSKQPLDLIQELVAAIKN